MKIIDGKNAVMGRLASYVAKQALQGEEFAIVNCDKVIVTGSRKNIQEHYKLKRSKVGSGQKGPKISRSSFEIVKRCIRGMLPDHREGRGRVAWKRIKCYNGVPKEFESKEKISSGKEKTGKFIYVKEIYHENN
ncbi:MAG: 50S ribosomal protein L13 [Nanoarchaeota archaeon]|nr:50S ribosomal protein L13 [Nanoarchaeota archaeon]